MVDPVVNKGKVTVSTGYNSTATSIVLATGQGAELPNPVVDGAYNLPWWDSTNYNDPADDPNFEIVRVTGPAGTGDTKTIVRAQEGTAATNKNNADATYKMHLGVTAKTITDLIPEHAATVIVGKSGNVDYLTTDYGSDGACIDAAIDYVNGLGGGSVLVREGTYTITTTLGSSSIDNVSIVGTGKNTILQNTTASSGATRTLEVGDDCEVRNIYFIGNITDTVTEYSGDNVSLLGHRNIVDSCRFYGGERAVRINAGTGGLADYNTVVNCIMKDFKEHGVVCSVSDYNTISGNYCDGGIRFCYLLDSNSNIVQGNTMENQSARGIFVVRGSKYNVVNGNHISNCASVGLSVESYAEGAETTADYNIISDNIVRDCTSASILVEGDATHISNGNVVNGNVCYNGADGVNVGQYTEGTIVSNNKIFSPAQAGIDCKGDYTTIEGNNINDSTDNGIDIDANAMFCEVSVNTIYDCGGTTYDGIRVDGTDNLFNSNIIYNAGRHGILIVGARNVISSNYIKTCQNRGVEVQSQNNIISNNLIMNNGQGAANTEGIRIIQTNNVVSGNLCTDDQGTKTQTYGYIVTSPGDYNVATGNNFRGNDTGAISTVGSHDFVSSNLGHNPVGAVGPPAVPATTVNYTNVYGYPCQVQVYGGTVTEIDIDDIATGLTSGVFMIPPGGTINITYSAAPSWRWWGL